MEIVLRLTGILVDFKALRMGSQLAESAAIKRNSWVNGLARKGRQEVRECHLFLPGKAPRTRLPKRFRGAFFFWRTPVKRYCVH
jgi:hypothetical protein